MRPLVVSWCHYNHSDLSQHNQPDYSQKTASLKPPAMCLTCLTVSLLAYLSHCVSPVLPVSLCLTCFTMSHLSHRVSPVWHVALLHGDVTLLQVDLQSSSLHQPPRGLQDLRRQHSSLSFVSLFPSALSDIPEFPLFTFGFLLNPYSSSTENFPPFPPAAADGPTAAPAPDARPANMASKQKGLILASIMWNNRATASVSNVK